MQFLNTEKLDETTHCGQSTVTGHEGGTTDSDEGSLLAVMVRPGLCAGVDRGGPAHSFSEPAR